IAAVWDGAAADRLRGRIAALPEAIRGATEAHTLGALDEYAAGWAALHQRACLGNQSGARSDALLDAQMRCLAGRKAAMADALALLDEGDPEALRDAPLVVQKLPPLAACEDDEALLAAIPPPADPTLREAVEGVRRRLTQAELMVHAGRHEEALRAATALREEAAGLGYPPLVGEAALAEGRIAIAALAWPAANAALEDALVAASAAGDDATAAEASARLLFTRGIEPAPGRGDPLLDRAHAEALVARLGERGDLQALVSNNVGVLLDLRGDRAGARERFAEAVRLAADDPRVDPIERASGYRRNLALATDDPAERERLFDAVADDLRARLGPDHLTLLTLALTRADTSAPGRALELRQNTCPKIQALCPGRYELCVACYHDLLHGLEAQGREGEAASAARGIAACLEAPIAPMDAEWMGAWRELGRGHSGLLGGDPAAAGDAFAAAITALAPHGELPGVAPLLADARIGEARAFLAQGTPERAREPLQAAITALGPIAEGSPQPLPRALLEAARALTRALPPEEADAATP
ncbi:MAG: hypothetical protein H6710_12555, partial [Myxococcales bacterium]|nr:hypothetical protein [Myxococcales bacterium]